MDNSFNENLVKYEYSNGKDRIFISYQHNSFDFVLKLSNYLENSGVKTWYAPRNIKMSNLWPEKLCEAIQNCKALLLLYTTDADRSKQVMREVLLADDFDKPILWLKLDKSNPTKTLKYYLSLIQSIDYDENEDYVFNVLTNILKSDIIDKNVFSRDKNVSSTETTQSIPIKPWTNNIFSFENENIAGEFVARLYFEVAKMQRNKTIILPTGRSAKSVFYGMIRVANEYEGCPFGECNIMNDTETFGVGPKNKTSRIKAINDYLIEPLRLMNKSPKDSQLTYMYGQSFDDDVETITKKQLQLFPPLIHAVSVSPFCEVIGYDVRKYAQDVTNDEPLLIEINDETKNYIDKEQKSNYIYSVGMKTALSSENLLILAFDKQKSNAIEMLMKEDVDNDIPMTLLRKNKNAIIVLTNDVVKEAGLEKFAKCNLSPTEAIRCVLNTKP